MFFSKYMFSNSNITPGKLFIILHNPITLAFIILSAEFIMGSFDMGRCCI